VVDRRTTDNRHKKHLTYKKVTKQQKRVILPQEEYTQDCVF